MTPEEIEKYFDNIDDHPKYKVIDCNTKYFYEVTLHRVKRHKIGEGKDYSITWISDLKKFMLKPRAFFREWTVWVKIEFAGHQRLQGSDSDFQIVHDPKISEQVLIKS